jgi:UPF0755 protein
MMKSIRRYGESIIYLWLCGVLFILFILGYIFYGVLWTVRLLQTKKQLLFVVAGGMFLSAGAAYYLFFPLYGQHRSVEIVIERGAKVRQIADSLRRHDIIISKKAFEFWVKATRIERRIQAGKCSFVTRGGVGAAARALLHAAPLDREVTVPEGLTVEQTAQRLCLAFPIDTTEFVRLCGDGAFIKECGLGQAASLEGYLFPDTYRFHPAATAAEIIRRMVAQFDEAYRRIDTASVAARHLTKADIVALASIVEKEATRADERPRIAGVFYNRLKLGIPLGADPTVRYIFRKFTGPLYVSELNSTSPYNTRRYKGLPPGPICSPGRASLTATVSPMETNELYFVAKWDGSGGHEFSVTNAEHVRKKNSIRQKNAERIMHQEASCVK